jgi:hypothetical protein
MNRKAETRKLKAEMRRAAAILISAFSFQLSAFSADSPKIPRVLDDLRDVAASRAAIKAIRLDSAGGSTERTMGEFRTDLGIDTNDAVTFGDITATNLTITGLGGIEADNLTINGSATVQTLGVLDNAGVGSSVLTFRSGEVLSSGGRSITFILGDTDRTLTLGGNFTTSGAHSTILRTSGATDITLPTTGTIATLTGTETLTSKIYTVVGGGTITGAGGDITLSPSGTGNMVVSGAGTAGAVTLGNANLDILIGNASATAKFRLLPFSNDIYFENTVSSGAIIFRVGAGTERWRIAATTGHLEAAGAYNVTTTGNISGANLTASGTVTISGDVILAKTITAAATTGAQTINKTSGSVNFAAAAGSLVVTNSLVSANSVIHVTVSTNDTTMKGAYVVPASGSFTIYPDAAPTGETRVNFLVTN